MCFDSAFFFPLNEVLRISYFAASQFDFCVGRSRFVLAFFFSLLLFKLFERDSETSIEICDDVYTCLIFYFYFFYATYFDEWNKKIMYQYQTCKIYLTKILRKFLSKIYDRKKNPALYRKLKEENSSR